MNISLEELSTVLSIQATYCPVQFVLHYTVHLCMNVGGNHKIGGDELLWRSTISNDLRVLS